jgi:hypothetical protein
MKTFMRPALAAAALLALLPTVIQAHFKLVEPASWIVEDDRGDPQKAGPCGGSNTDWGKPSYAVTQAVGGGTIHLKVQETIYHPGHYRVALAVNSPSELPGDPKATTMPSDRGPQSVSAEIMSPVQMPVLADGLFVHAERTATPFETDVTLPNISCKKCTLQVIQFMEQHGANNPGNYTYHHCATIQITADAKKPIDAAWPKERQGT